MQFLDQPALYKRPESSNSFADFNSWVRFPLPAPWPGSAALAALAISMIASTAHAAVTISSSPTANINCTGGVCAPTAKKAVLNVGDLESLLASGDVKVTTTGSGVQADDIIVDASLGWSGANVLALDAWQSVLVEKPVSVSGAGGLSVATDDGGKNGYFGFLGKGHVTFANLSDMLTISGSAYTLVGDIATLAADIAQNPAGDYALANDYDAKIDGIYATSPIPTEFGGNFEGLGNTISRLSIDDPENADYVGLFARPASGSTVENTRLLKLSISGNAGDVGGIAAVSFGFISNDFVSGTLISSVQNGGAYIGGLVGYNSGMITRSHATGTIGSDQFGTTGGGLVGYNFNGSITQSYADCVVSSGDDGGLGGLVGSNAGPITQSYSMGSVAGGDGTWVGGLTGANGMITQAYSTTALKDLGHKNHDAGGLIGVDKAGGNSSDYWDTSTSRIKKLNEGAGTPKNDPGITGLTTEQLQSGLPSGFDPKVWAEDPKINGGFPYLINNPPRE